MTKPKLGDIVYINSELYLSHGEDDIIGGRVEVEKVEEEGRFVWLTFKGFPDSKYNWAQLEPLQGKLRTEFGEAWAHTKPDPRPEFNQGWNS